MNTLTIDEACTKYGIESKRLIGFCARDEFTDLLVVDRGTDGTYILLDDWRLARAAHKS